MKPSTLITLIVLLLLGLIYFSGTIAHLATDWAWFSAVGFAGVFRTTLLARIGLGLVSGLIAFALLQANAAIALRGSQGRGLQLSGDLAATSFGRWLMKISPMRVATGVCAFIALIAGLGATSFWQDFLLFLHRQDFGFTDPVLGHDAAFYVFTLPFVEFVRGLLLGIIALSTLAVAALYAVRGGIRLDLAEVHGQVTTKGLEVSSQARKHIGALVATWIVLGGIGSWLARYNLMYNQTGLISGPGKADVALGMPLLAAQAILTWIAAGVVLYGIARGRTALWVSGAVAVLVVGVLSSILPNVYEKLVVLPNELVLEKPYIENHIAATRYAFALDQVSERRLSGDARLSWSDIEANEATIKNIRLWDHHPLRETFAQVQEIRTYYDFPGVDNDRYMVDGELRQTMLSPRELDPTSLPARARTWVNESMVYTHGYGIALGPVNELTPEGLPVLWVKDLPPQIDHKKDLNITQPAIYYGEAMHQVVFVDTKNQEFDYPTGDQNKYTTYSGKGGVRVGGMLWRALWSLRLQNAKVLLTTDITPTSKVLIYRDVLTRVRRVAPFLVLDHDPYMAIAGGRLVWIVDAYTASDHFPYAQRIDGVSYMRNSVKVVIDAYDGTMTFYEMDPGDPIVQAWASVYPGLFTPAEQMPADIRAHIRYPIDYFTVQAELYATYHMTDARMFYNREDQWAVPVVGGAPMQPYYTVMKLPGEQSEEFILMLPFVPRNKPNLAAWMVARSDGSHYGSVVTYSFPKDKMIYGPSMITARFQQDDQISEKMSLWNQQGSQVQLGTLLIVPIEESLIYVQPLYLRASQDSIPELKRVLVGYENEIAMSDTLEGALAKLFGKQLPSVATEQEGEGPGGGVPPEGTSTPPPPASKVSLAQQAQDHYQKLTEAARQGDWTTFGQQMDALGKVLGKLVPPSEGSSTDPNKTAGNPAPAPAKSAPAKAAPVTP